MQYVQTRFENLARRIALAGVCSRRQAEDAISKGFVAVDGQVVKKNFDVPDYADVCITKEESVMFAPPPDFTPKIWALGKPRGVATEVAPLYGKEDLRGLRELIKAWDSRNKENFGERWVDSANIPSHFISINHVPVMAHGIVLLTTDGEFAENMRDPQNSILTSLRVKVSGEFLADKDPESVFRSWKGPEGVKAGGVDFGRVFVKVLKRSAEGNAWLRVDLVSTRERDVSMLLHSKANIRVFRYNVDAFGPYSLSSIPPGQVSVVPLAPVLRHLVPTRELKTVLLPKQLIDPTTGILNGLVSS